MTISALVYTPNSVTNPTTFDTDMDGHLAELNPMISNINTAIGGMNAAAGANAISIAYTFSTTTTDSDPGAGTLRLDNATQNAATTIRTDLLDSAGTDWTAVLDTFDASSSVIKGQVRLSKVGDGTKYLLLNVTARAAPSGYRNITVAVVGYSAASPFANGDAVTLAFTRNGDMGTAGGAVAIAYTFSTTTTDADPGNGFLRLSNATQNAATTLRTDLLDTGATDWTAVLDTLDASNSTVKGQLRISKIGDPTKWLLFNVTARAAPSGYRNFTIANTGYSAASPFANNEVVMVSFTRTGDLGQAGGAVAITYTFDTTTTDADPGNGKLRLSSATQNAATVIRTDLLDTGSVDWTAVLDIMDASSSTVKGYIRLSNATDSTKWLLFSVTSRAAPSGYRNLTVVCVASSAASPFSNADTIVLSFTRNGDAGVTFTGGTMVTAINEAPAVTIASASTVNIGAAAANTVNISGVVTINAFDTIAAGAVRRLIFGGILTWTYNASSMILFGAANITTAANDVAEVESLGSGNWKMLSYSRATGQAFTNTLTSAQNTARATVASAATTADIFAATGNQIDYTGTATATIFPNAPQAGAERVLICAGACAFTAGANMLIDGVTSGNTVTCAANDKVIVRAISTTQFTLTRIKYDGTSQVSAGITTYTSTASGADITLTSTSNGYQKFSTTAPDVALNLPDATTLSVGLKFMAENTGSYVRLAKDNAGTIIGAIPPGMTAQPFLQVATPAAGTWKLLFGDKAADSGLHWWGNVMAKTSSVPAAGTNPYFSCFAISSKYGVVVWDDGTNTKIQGYALTDSGISWGNVSQLIAGHIDSGHSLDGVSVNGTTRLFLVYSKSAVDTYFQTVDINTSTLNLTLNTAANVGAAGGKVNCCDIISTTLAFATYDDGAGHYKCATVSINAGTGACTLNTGVAYSASQTLFVGCCVNSSTLATIYYSVSTSTVPQIVRVPLSGTTVTPGTAVAVTSRKPLVTFSADTTYANKAATLIALTATTSYGLARDSANNLYAEVFTDTGSTVTITETLIAPNLQSGSESFAQACSLYKSTNCTKGLIQNISDAGTGGAFSVIETWNTINVSGTTPALGPTLANPPSITSLPPFSLVKLSEFFRYNYRGYNGVGVMPFLRDSTPKMYFQPVACA